MLEIIKVIALLCQVSTADKSVPLSEVLEFQRVCQKRYIMCVRAGKNDTLAEDLEACILEQK